MNYERQKRWRLRQLAAGKCRTCTKKRKPGNAQYCPRHADENAASVLAIQTRHKEAGMCAQCRVKPLGKYVWRCDDCQAKERESPRRKNGAE
jgi:ribosomal protein L37AE/L43A